MICDGVLKEVAREMAQHGIPLSAVAPAIFKRCEEFEAEGKTVDAAGQRLGGAGVSSMDLNGGAQAGGQGRHNTPRDLALAAAERRQARATTGATKDVSEDPEKEGEDEGTD